MTGEYVIKPKCYKITRSKFYHTSKQSRYKKIIAQPKSPGRVKKIQIINKIGFIKSRISSHFLYSRKTNPIPGITGFKQKFQISIKNRKTTGAQEQILFSKKVFPGPTIS